MQRDVSHTTRYIYVFTDECLFMSYYLISTVSAEKQINLYKLKFIKHIAKICQKRNKSQHIAKNKPIHQACKLA